MRLRRLVAIARARLPAGGDAGMTIVEVGVAAFILAIVLSAIIGSMGAGLQLVGHSRQRSAGVAVAQERLERVRNLPYEQVAICKSTDSTSRCFKQPQYEASADHPDHSVSTDGTGYTVEGSTTEPLIVDEAAGGVAHVDDPFSLGSTEFSVYQYVTWVDDPSIDDPVNNPDRDYKRITVVVTWKFPVHSGPSHRVVQTSFVGREGVVVPSVSPSPTPTATVAVTPTPTITPVPEFTPSPTLQPSSACGSMQVLSASGAAAGYTNSTNVPVRLQKATSPNCTPSKAELSNDGVNWVVAATTFPITISWTIPSGDGAKTIYVQFYNAEGVVTSPITKGITLDQTRPTPASNLRKTTCQLQSNDRQVTMEWAGADAASDTNWLGYRVYKSVDLGAYAALVTTTSRTAFDPGVGDKSHGSIRYIVRVYDKAGNESVDSNVLSFSKNNC